MKSLKNSQNISFVHCCWFNAKLSIYSPHIFLMCINIAFDYLQWCTLWDRYIFTIINSLVTYILTYARFCFWHTFHKQFQNDLATQILRALLCIMQNLVLGYKVLVTLCFYPDKLVLVLKLLRKSLCAVSYYWCLTSHERK